MFKESHGSFAGLIGLPKVFMFVGIVSKPKTEIQGSKLHMLAHVSELIIWHKVEIQTPWKEKSLCFYICTKKSCLYIYIYINILASSCFRSMGFYGGWSVKPQLGIANVTLGFPEMFSSFNIYMWLWFDLDPYFDTLNLFLPKTRSFPILVCLGLIQDLGRLSQPACHTGMQETTETKGREGGQGDGENHLEQTDG